VPEFDVALSFAGEQREYVRAVANLLTATDVKVFYDEMADLWGHDMAVHFDEVYRTESRFVVPFVSEAYAAKAWPRHEFRSALARAVEEEGRYILPVRFDDTEIPGLRPTINYLDARVLAPADIAANILRVLGRENSGGGNGHAEAASPPVSARVPKLPPTNFNPYAEAESAVSHLRTDLTRRARGLEANG
jgi:hypothetical protein